MKKPLMVAGAVLVLGTAWAVAGTGTESGDGAGEGKARRLERLRTEVGLSDEQIAELQKMRSENRDRMMRQRTEMRIARQQLQDLITAPTVDTAAIEAQTKRLTDLEAAMTQARVNQQLALRQVLSPEQLEKLRALRSEHPGKRGPGRRGFGHGRRGDGAEAPAPPQ